MTTVRTDLAVALELAKESPPKEKELIRQMASEVKALRESVRELLADKNDAVAQSRGAAERHGLAMGTGALNGVRALDDAIENDSMGAFDSYQESNQDVADTAPAAAVTSWICAPSVWPCRPRGSRMPFEPSIE